MITSAFVKVWGETVGAVVWNAETGVASFEYDPKFIATNYDLAPLKMPISTSNKRIFSFPELRNVKTFKGLPGLLADVLPDDYGNQLINSWLAQNGRPENSMNPVELLCFIGTRGMGALEFEPSQFKSNKRAFTIELDDLITISQKMLAKREGFETNLSEDEQQAMLDILKVGTSAGGARPKAIIAYNEKTGQVKSGQTTAPKGFEHWIIKLDTISDVQFGESTGFGRVEMAYYQMAKACKIEMMECRLLEENGRAHFMTKRFDREGGTIKHHIQTFCAMKHFDYNLVTNFSYEQLFQTMRELKLTYSDAEQLFRRMVFNVIARNCDDHTKNFAFRLKKDGKWELAPAYDICHAYQPNNQWISQHALSINGMRTNITKEDLLVLGKSIKHKNAEETIQEINEVVSRWKDFADEVHVSPKLRDEISHTLIRY